MNRRIRRTVWDNWNGYVGTRKVVEFGTDRLEAERWVAGGESPEREIENRLTRRAPQEPETGRFSLRVAGRRIGHP